MNELEQLKRENELLRELVKAKDETIAALKNAPKEKEIVYVPTYPPVSIPSIWTYPPPPQPPFTVTCGSVTAGNKVGEYEIIGIYN